MNGRIVGSPLTDHETAVLAAYARYGYQPDVAEAFGVKIQTIKNTLTNAYDRLAVTNAIDAFRAIGWLRVPDDLDQDRRERERLIRATVDAVSDRMMRTPGSKPLYESPAAAVTPASSPRTVA